VLQGGLDHALRSRGNSFQWLNTRLRTNTTMTVEVMLDPKMAGLIAVEAGLVQGLDANRGDHGEHDRGY
jgi:hypothetical protein